MINRRQATALLAGTAAFQNAGAQTFPNKPLRIVLGWPPGGPADFIARLFAKKLAERMSQPVIVDNRPGAAAAIAAKYVANAEPDGHTLFLASMDTHALNPNYYRKLGYDPIKDFTPVGGLCKLANALCVGNGKPWTSVSALIAEAKAKPGVLNYATWGAGSLPHVTAELLMQKTGTQFTHVPYQGSGPAMLALMSGEVDLMVMALNAAMPSRSKLRILAATSEARVVGAEDVPTLQEQGIAVDVSNWICLVAPKSTPAAAVNTLSGHLVEIGRQPEVIALLKQQFAEPFNIGAAELDRYIRSELTRWAAIMQRANIVEART